MPYYLYTGKEDNFIPFLSLSFYETSTTAYPYIHKMTAWNSMNQKMKLINYFGMLISLSSLLADTLQMKVSKL